MAERTRLPDRRTAETIGFRHNGLSYTATIGRDPQDRIGEVFVDAAKVGSGAAYLGQDLAVLISIALQFGVPLEVLRSGMARESTGEPHTVAGAVLDLLMKETSR